MDELEIGGKKYLSSRRAAKEHKYHIDYIGQLIRAGKVAGKKVGRAWYVEEKSLNTYLRQEAGEKAYSTLVREEPVAEAEPLAETPALEPVAEDSIETVSVEITSEEEKISEPEMESPIKKIEVPIAQAEEANEEKNAEEASAELPAEEESIEEQKEPEMVVLAESPKEKEKDPAIRIIRTEPRASVSPSGQITLKKSNTLTYVEDNEPLMPVLEGRTRRNADFIAMPTNKVAEAPLPEEEDESFVPVEVKEDSYQADKPIKSSIGKKIKKGAMLVGLGVAVLAIVAAASSMLAASVQVKDGKPASVSFTIK